MPYLTKSNFSPPFFLRNRHLQTLVPQKLRRIREVQYSRERISTPDGDFIDLDWSRKGGSRCVVLYHGLEGHTSRPYMLGMVRMFNREGWDAVAVNLRGCSGEPNLLPRAYHQGSSDDVATTMAHIATTGSYTSLACIGFSLGGNIVLKYLGEKQWDKPQALSAAVAISAPADLSSCADHMHRRENSIYLRYFITMLSEKVRAKHARFPEQLPLDGLDTIRTFTEFDDRFTAPLNGFANAADYWEQSSSLPLLPAIGIPTLMLSALDDPMLTPKCFPGDLARMHPALTLETPRFGGHMGFLGQGRRGNYWHEHRSFAFVTSADSAA